MDNLESKMRELYKEAMKQTPDTIGDFVKHAMCDYQHDYGSVCVAVAACAIAGVYAADNTPQGGITGFQAGFVMWEFARQMVYSGNKCGLRMIDYDNMIYPQYADKFEKTITKETFELLQKTAKEKLEIDSEHAQPAVIEHWKSIASGNVPFGYTVKDD